MQVGNPSTSTPFFDPRPLSTSGPAYSFVDDVVVGNSFLVQTNYKGAFSTSDNWLVGLSWLDENARTPDNVAGVYTSGDITTDTKWTNDAPILLTGQVFVRGATLTIEAGTMIMAYRDDGTDSGVAPALVIERNASIIAVGAQNNPITFTSA
eukprot:scaffold1625_cov302-Pinguiococcus_pyrenoidosus.AAC.1